MLTTLMLSRRGEQIEGPPQNAAWARRADGGDQQEPHHKGDGVHR